MLRGNQFIADCKEESSVAITRGHFTPVISAKIFFIRFPALKEALINVHLPRTLQITIGVGELFIQ